MAAASRALLSRASASQSNRTLRDPCRDFRIQIIYRFGRYILFHKMSILTTTFQLIFKAHYERCKISNPIIATLNVLYFTHHRLQAICYQEMHSRDPEITWFIIRRSISTYITQHIRNLISRFPFMRANNIMIIYRKYAGLFRIGLAQTSDIGNDAERLN